jgi:hypothetical protein
MATTVTVTGVIGPGTALTAKVFTNVLVFTVDSVNNVLTMKFDSGVIVDVSVAAAGTVTGTKSGSTWTLTIS